MTIRWYRYTQTASGRNHLPQVNVNLCHGSTRMPGAFIVDTGAVQTFAPARYAKGLMQLDWEEARPSGGKDAQGRALLGIPVELDLELLSHYPLQPLRLRETVWFCRELVHGLLGQSTLFEKYGAAFLNFPGAKKGRRFGLFPRPPEPPE